MKNEKDIQTDEILEEIWTLNETGTPVTMEVLRSISKIQPIDEPVRRIIERQDATLKNNSLILTDKGERAAREIVRRNRLTAVLLSQLFELSSEETEDVACDFEHILNPRVTDSICTLLGHPPSTQSGAQIPRGECCRRLRGDIKPLVKPLASLGVGENARIAFIIPHAQERLAKLSTLGLVPGKYLKLIQKSPSFVVEIDETTLAMDGDFAKEIYVSET